MSYLLKAVFLLSAVLSVYSIALKDCECWDGYEAKQDSDGKTMCYGLMVLGIKPCNLPVPPKCVCTKDTVTGILTDSEGTWCSQRAAGQDVKKWPCENEADWAAYKVKYAEFEKNYKQ